MKQKLNNTGWEDRFNLIWGEAPKGSLKWKKGQIVKEFIEILLEEAIQEGYNRGRIKAMEQHGMRTDEHLLEERGKVVAVQICELIDDIESAESNGMEGWKMFKRIRNTIRDRYILAPELSHLQEKGEE